MKVDLATIAAMTAKVAEEATARVAAAAQPPSPHALSPHAPSNVQALLPSSVLSQLQAVSTGEAGKAGKALYTALIAEATAFRMNFGANAVKEVSRLYSKAKSSNNRTPRLHTLAPVSFVSASKDFGKRNFLPAKNSNQLPRFQGLSIDRQDPLGLDIDSLTLAQGPTPQTIQFTASNPTLNLQLSCPGTINNADIRYSSLNHPNKSSLVISEKTTEPAQELYVGKLDTKASPLQKQLSSKYANQAIVYLRDPSDASGSKDLCLTSDGKVHKLAAIAEATSEPGAELMTISPPAVFQTLKALEPENPQANQATFTGLADSFTKFAGQLTAPSLLDQLNTRVGEAPSFSYWSQRFTNRDESFRGQNYYDDEHHRTYYQCELGKLDGLNVEAVSPSPVRNTDSAELVSIHASVQHPDPNLRVDSYPTDTNGQPSEYFSLEVISPGSMINNSTRLKANSSPVSITTHVMYDSRRDQNSKNVKAHLTTAMKFIKEFGFQQADDETNNGATLMSKIRALDADTRIIYVADLLNRRNDYCLTADGRVLNASNK